MADLSPEQRRHRVLVSPALARGFVVLGRTAVVLGRGRECDVPVMAESVSRRHAKIFPDGFAFAISDLGSTNGTYVNGAKVAGVRRLENGDTISIGAAQVRFQVVEGPREEIASRLDHRDEQTDRIEPSAPLSLLLGGRFTRAILHQVCQLVEVHRHSGTLRIETPGGLKGHVRFKDGTVIDAQIAWTAGERALREILMLPEGQYAFHGTSGAEAAPKEPIEVSALATIETLMRAEAEAIATKKFRRTRSGKFDLEMEEEERP